MSWTRIMATGKKDIEKAIKQRPQRTLKEIIKSTGSIEVAHDNIYWYIDEEHMQIGGKAKARDIKIKDEGN